MKSSRARKASVRCMLCAIVGVASALMVLEIQRMPVAHVVNFSMFAPIPYVIEAFVIGAAALVVGRFRQHLAAVSACRWVTGAVVVVSTWLLLWGIDFDDTVMLEIRIVYRVSSGLLVVLWGERLIPLGARRAACAIASACLASGIATVALAFVTQPIIDAVLGALPLIASAALVLFRAEDGVPSRPLPIFPWECRSEKIVAVGLMALPLLSRATTISTQNSWMPLQRQTVSAVEIQVAIGVAVVLGAAVLGLILRFAWNRSFILVFDLVVVPITFMAFYTAQLANDLWALHLLIVDSTYKIVLFYVLMTPYLFPRREGGFVSSAPLYASFAFLIGARALFSGLHAMLSASAYAALAVVTVLAVFAAASVLSLLYVHQQVRRSAPHQETAALPVRLDTEMLCRALEARFGLTPREGEVLFLLAQNYRAPYIAEKLVVSQSTVKTHMRNLYGKLGVHSQAELLLLVDREAEISSN